MKFILGSIPNGAGTMVLWFLWSLILVRTRQAAGSSITNICVMDRILKGPT